MIREVVGVSAGLTTATTTYADGDQLGTEIVFAGVVSDTSAGGLILAAYLTDDSDVLAATDLALFNAATTPAADNAAAAWSDADMQKSLGIIRWATADVIDVGANRLGVVRPSSAFWTPTKNLYGNLITRSANAVFASGATAVRVRLLIETD